MPSRQAWISIGRSAGAKVLVLPVSALLGIVNVRLIIDTYGLDAFAQYGLLVAIASMLPFADLGISAVLMNVVGESEDPRRDERVRQTLTSCYRLLALSFTVLVSLTLFVTAMGWWRFLLGDSLHPSTGPLAAAACLLVLAASLFVGPGQRILAGVHKHHLTIVILGLQTPLVLATLLVVTRLDRQWGAYIAVIPYVVTMLLQLVICIVASRMIRPNYGDALRNVPKLRAERGVKVSAVAWPMLVWMVGTVVAMQTDRVILSHVSSSEALAQYNLAAQIFLPVLHVASAAGFALWPIFAKQRAESASTSPLHTSLVFGGCAALVCLLLALFTPLLTRLASGGQVVLASDLIVAFSILVVFQALKYPLNVYLTDAAGLRLQMYVLLASMPINLLLSYELATRIGAAGPVIGSAIAIALQYFACLRYGQRRHRSPLQALEAADSVV